MLASNRFTTFSAFRQARYHQDCASSMAKLPSEPTKDLVVPLSAEEAVINVRKVERGRVRVAVQTTTRDHTVEEVLTHEHVEVTRVAMAQVVEAAPPVREVGDTTIVSIVEEVIVTERRLVLKEEIHLRRVRTTTRHTEVVALREQHAVIDRLDALQPVIMADPTPPIPVIKEKI